MGINGINGVNGDSGAGEKVNANNNTSILALCKSCISNAPISKPGAVKGWFETFSPDPQSPFISI